MAVGKGNMTKWIVRAISSFVRDLNSDISQDKLESEATALNERLNYLKPILREESEKIAKIQREYDETNEKHREIGRQLLDMREKKRQEMLKQREKETSTEGLKEKEEIYIA